MQCGIILDDYVGDINLRAGLEKHGFLFFEVSKKPINSNVGRFFV